MTMDNYVIKEYAIDLFASLSEKKIYDFVRIFADEGTLARMESDIIARNPDAVKSYSSFKEYMQEMESEMNG